MALAIPNASEQVFLQSYLDLIDFTDGGHRVRLFTNDPESGLTQAQIEALDASDFTEATFTGYAAVNRTGGWSYDQNDPTVATNTPCVFQRTGGSDQTVLGYYVTRGTSGTLAWYEYFPGPILFDNAGDQIQLTPTLTIEEDREAMPTARGVIARQTITSTGSSLTADALTDFALNNVDVDASRLYRVHLSSDVFISANGRWLVSFRVDGSDTLRLGDVQATNGSQNFYLDACGLWTPATGTYNLTIFADEGSGAGDLQFQASASAPRSFWVEDIGPR